MRTSRSKLVVQIRAEPAGVGFKAPAREGEMKEGEVEERGEEREGEKGTGRDERKETEGDGERETEVENHEERKQPLIYTEKMSRAGRAA